ncbi:APC family permease [Actinoplanes sp. NPDC051861]|uniref:APC family permease n=1 Tax=Actinoplanes sp. NPDC051861 TaxID=3155170 RepID=UPI003444D921
MPYSTPAAVESNFSRALARDRLGPFAIGSAIASSVAPLTVVTLVVPTAVASTGLIGVPIAIGAVAALLFVFVVGYLAMARRIPNAGAFYAYVAHGVGRPAGVGTAWFALATYTCFQLCCYGGLGAMGAPLASRWIGFDVPWFVLAFAAWALVAVLGASEVKVSEKVMVVLVVAETVLILFYSIAIMLGPGFTFNFTALSFGNLWQPTVGILGVLGMTSFAGIEQSSVYIEESKDPRRTIPVATYATVGAIMVVYALASWAQISAAGPNVVEKAAAEGGDLFFNQATAVLGGLALDVGHLLLATGLIAALVAFHNAITRYTFALGREGVLPRLFGRTTLKGAPRNASMAQTGFAFLVLAVYAVAGWDPLVQLFYWGSTAGGLGILLLYAMTSISVIGYFGRYARTETVWQRSIAPGIATVVLVVVATLAFANLDILFGVAPGSGPARIVPIAFLLIFTFGTCWGLVLRRTKPEVYDGIGRGTRSTNTTSGLAAIH